MILNKKKILKMYNVSVLHGSIQVWKKPALQPPTFGS